MLFTTFVLKDLPQGYIISYLFKLLRILSLSRILVEISLTFIFHLVWENLFQFMVFKVLENALYLRIFTHVPVIHSKIQAKFSENLFPQDKKGGKNYDLLYQN